MLNKLKRINNEGFTIIEVMIVLAIAALILIIVLLAVPALQRSANNTSRKSDASAITTALSNSVNDSSGALPTGVTPAATKTLQITNATTEQANLGYYLAANVELQTIAAGGAIITPATAAPGTALAASKVTTDTVDIIVGETCNGITPTLNANSISVWYDIQAAGTTNGSLQCDAAS